MRKIYTVVFALMVLLSVTMCAVALESKTIDRQNGETATAYWYDTEYTTYLSVTKTLDGTDIHIVFDSWTSHKVGEIITQENVFNINKKLETATLSPLALDLLVYDKSSKTWTTETTTIQAQWTGVGDATIDRINTISTPGETPGIFIQKFSKDSTSRQATATGSIGNIDMLLSFDYYTNLFAFKSTSMTIVK